MELSLEGARGVGDGDSLFHVRMTGPVIVAEIVGLGS